MSSKPDYILSFREAWTLKKEWRAGSLGVRAAAQDPGSVPGTHMAAHNHL